MSRDEITLIGPTAEYYDAFCAMAEEFHAAGDVNWPHGGRKQDDLALQNFDAYLARCVDWAEGRNLPDDYVPCSDYWLIGPDGLLGTGNLRHCLTPRLFYEGGNIGYCIRPSQRHKGYAHRLCAMMLEKSRAIGLTRVLLTCQKANTASQLTIEKNGGVFDDERPSIEHDGLIRRYWIDLAP
jgi:predicted acetyltransferase